MKTSYSLSKLPSTALDLSTKEHTNASRASWQRPPRPTQPTPKRIIRQTTTYRESARARTPGPAATDRGSTGSLTTRRSPSQSEAALLFITPEIENTVQEWLSALEVEPVSPDIRIPTIQDPFRNGVLLCQLVMQLENRKIPGVIWAPASYGDASANYYKALEVVKRGHPEAFNYSYCRMMDKLGKGNEEAVWGLYWSLYVAYPRVLPLHLEQVKTQLPYDCLATKRLEIALLTWINSLQVLSMPHTSIIPLLPALSTGSLLCRIVATSSQVRIEGIHDMPKTEGGAIMNVRKALDVLKQLKGMSQKFIWRQEKQILRGELGVLMGLLEDLYRWYDGLPARKPGDSYHADGPYLGPEKPKKFNGLWTATTQQTPEKPAEDLGETPSWKLSIVPPLQESIIVTPKHLFHSPESNQFELTSSPSPKQSPPEPLRKVNAEILSWLSKIGLKLDRSVDFSGERIKPCISGVLLCDIIGALERVPLTGVSTNPKTRAACLQNLRRVLRHLYSKPNFPQSMMYIEDDLLSGDGPVTRKLLYTIQELYRYSASKPSYNSKSIS